MFQFKKVKYKEILYIDELSIEEGQITTLIGESGSGKSTLMKLLNHLISPDEGEILYKGQPITEYDPVELRRQVLMLSQQPALFGKTIEENLQAGLKFTEKSKASEQEMKEVLEAANLKKGLEEEAEQLSGGEQQRLSLARVLLIDPPVLLLDEPTSALDDEMEDLVMDRLIRSARSSQKTVVMVTHSKSIAEQYSDRQIQVEQFSLKKKEAVSE